MTYLRYTYVDAHTGIPCDQAPCRNGPAPPPIPGLSYLWAPEGQYPTARPVFYAQCPGPADTAVPGVLAVLSDAEYAAALGDEIATRRAALRYPACSAPRAASRATHRGRDRGLHVS